VEQCDHSEEKHEEDGSCRGGTVVVELEFII
jgi:hypothetical protein